MSDDSKLKGSVDGEDLPSTIEADYPDIAAARRPDPTAEPKPQPEVLPGDMAIATSRNRILVVIRPNGELVFGPDYTPDEAAEIFWSTMAFKRIGSEQRLQLVARMENLILSAGAADIANETAQRNLARVRSDVMKTHEVVEGEGERIKAAIEAAQKAQRTLEERVSQLIDFGRRLVTEPEVTNIPRPNRTVQEPN